MRSAYDLRPDTALDWMDRARCRQYDPEWWSVPNYGNEDAKRICHGCPVKVECAEWGKDLQGTIVAGKTRHVAKREPRGNRRCPYCHRTFTPTNHKQVACSRRCNDTAYRARLREAARGR